MSKLDLINLIRTVAYKEGEFVLASGKKSNFYIDCRKVILHPDNYILFRPITVAFNPKYKQNFVAGVELGGALMVPSIAQITDLYGLVVRKEVKGHGFGQQIAGDVERITSQRRNVILLEDVITTGGSALRAMQVLEDAGAAISQVITIVDRQEGGREAIESAGYELHSLVTKEDIIGDHK